MAMFVLVLNTGCNDWIDIEPENDLIQQEFWKTQDDLLSVVAATYDAARANTGAAFIYGEIRADFITLPIESDLGAIANNKITPTTYGIGWGNFYNVINLANTVMHYAPIVQGQDKTVTDEVLDNINAEMIFLRSLTYFYLVRTWKEVPLILNATISDTVDFYVPKSSESTIINQLIKDLEYASTIASPDVNKQYRANKYSILALLADVYLWAENYDKCESVCNTIIGSGKFSLEGYDTWFNLYYPGNAPTESLFEIQYEDSYEGQTSLMSNVHYDFDVYLGKYDYDSETDIRYCKKKGPTWKYVGLDETGSFSKQRRSGEFSANFIYYRFSEILLMKAECLAEKDDLEGANDLVSQITERAGTVHDDEYNITSFRTALLAERGREFGAEGKRWFEILRFAKRNNWANQQLLIGILLNKAENAQDLAIMRANVLDTMSYYLPIEEEEIKLNRNLVQNPFYDR